MATHHTQLYSVSVFVINVSVWLHITIVLILRYTKIFQHAVLLHITTDDQFHALLLIINVSYCFTTYNN